MATESTEEHGKTDFTAETQRTQRKILIENGQPSQVKLGASMFNLQLQEPVGLRMILLLASLRIPKSDRILGFLH